MVYCVICFCFSLLMMLCFMMFFTMSFCKESSDLFYLVSLSLATNLDSLVSAFLRLSME